MTPDEKKRLTAVELRAPNGSSVMQIDWADGHKSVYPHEVLRGFCPCAHCQGHQGPIKFVPGGNTDLTDIEEIGNYAVRLSWGDSHGFGIYSFQYLRQLCACEQCLAGEDMKERRFGR